MGAVQNVIDRLRGAFIADKERGGELLAKGSTSPTYPDSGYDLLQAYGYDALSDYLRLEHDLLSRYVDYEEMDDYPEIASSIDIYADDASQPDTQLQRTVWVSSPDKTLQGVLDDLFHKRLRLDEEIWEIVRSLVKYGNDYEEMLVTQDGVVGLNFLPAPTVRRVEGPRGELYGFVQDFKGRFGYSPQEFQKILAQRTDAIRQTLQPGVARVPGNILQRVSALEPWEVAHFRLRGKHRRSVYGYSVLEPARWIWKRLMLLEDAAMIYRLQRAPERYAFYVDVGDLPPGEALAFVNKIRQQHKKKRFVNPSTGKLDLKFEPLPVSNDTPIPLLDGRTLSIEEMAREHESGEKHWVYSIDRTSGRVVPGEVSWVGKTRENGRALRLTFDDGGTAVMAPDHPVMLRTGEYREAELLQVGDRVKPLYRKVSSHAKGDGLDGYELVFDPATSKYRYTYRVVADALGIRERGQVAHHEDFDRLNNDPRNLVGMWREDHTVLHAELGHLGGKRVAELRKTDRALDERLRAASSRNIRAFNASEERRALTARTNRERDQVSIVRRYNESPLHTEHNAVRAERKRAFWADEERATKAREAMSHTYPTEFVEGVRSLVESGEAQTTRQVVDQVNAGPLLHLVRDANPRKPIRRVHRHFMLKVYRSQGYDDFADFKRAVGGNHKVVSIEEVEPCDHYCMTVERWHNFALSLRDEDGEPMYRSGVFVKNSQDDDFWVPVRKGVEGTRIEVLGGPSWQHMDDVEYFQTKLFTAVKVPKAYLAQDENTARAVLSSEDVRFARSVLRVQREVRNGLRKVTRTHLAALNIDPYATEYTIHMTVPSAIFELAQLEVRNARADLASRMREHVSLRWVLENVYQLSDEDIKIIIQERSEDVIREGKAQAEVEKLSAMAQAAAERGAGGGAPAESLGPPSGMKILERKLAALPRQLRGAITERELLRGSREAEKRSEEKLNSILRSNDANARRLKESISLLREVVAAGRGR